MRLILFFLLFSTICSGQIFVQGTNINELEDVNYITINGYNKGLFKNKIIITIDYGQGQPIFKAQKLKDKDGNDLEFKSMTGALNFMIKNGWEYINSYSVVEQSNSVYHYLMKRKE